MTNFLNALNNIIWGPPLIILMIVTGVYFTLRTKFFQVRHLGYIFSRTLGRLFHRTDESADEKGLLTPYEAIATAVGGSVGFGNIAGVATAVTTGGPGAVFWMWLTAFLGMLIKQVEVTLVVYYRRTDENGVPYGGPTYYMERGLGEERHWGKLWLPLAFVFGIGIFSTFFISASTYTTSEVVAQSLGIPQAIAALIIVCILYVMIWGGVKKLGQILTKLVPVMSLSYLILGLVIIVMHYENILPTLGGNFQPGVHRQCRCGRFRGRHGVSGHLHRHGPQCLLQRGRLGLQPHGARLQQDPPPH